MNVSWATAIGFASGGIQEPVNKVAGLVGGVWRGNQSVAEHGPEHGRIHLLGLGVYRERHGADQRDGRQGGQAS